MNWQPIATAPKDRTEVLLAAPERVTYGYWLTPSETPRLVYQDGFAPEEVWDDFEPHWMSWDGGFTEEHPPTHWMPLPPAPTASPVVHPAGERTASSEGPAKRSGYLARPDEQDGATPPIQQGVVEALAYWVPKSRPFSSETRDVVCIAHNNAWDRAHAALACLRATSGENGNG